MWSLLDKITAQVSNYSSSLGQVWYILVFGYRLVAITTLGGAVYGDEQGAFKCSESIAGCTNVCYNSFAKISHMRFWAFQLIAITTPTIFFHFYTLHVQGQIEKIKQAETKLNDRQNEDNAVADTDADYNARMEKDIRKLPRRRRQVGKFKVQEIYQGTEKKEVVQTRKIRIALLTSLGLRLVLESVFSYIGYKLFNIKNGRLGGSSVQNFLWMEVPAKFICGVDDDVDVHEACYQHTSNNGYVPCWVSRPYEKTVFLRYMNILSLVCLIITIVEVMRHVHRWVRHQKPKAPKAYDVEQSIPMARFDPLMSYETVMKNSRGPSNIVKQHPNGNGKIYPGYQLGEIHRQERRPSKNGDAKSREYHETEPYDSDCNMSIDSRSGSKIERPRQPLN